MDDAVKPPLDLASGKHLMAQGPAPLHALLAARLKPALGHPLPQMELQFHDLSLSVDTVVVDDKPDNDLPTLWNTVRKSLAGLSRKKQVVHKEILKNVTGSFKPGTMTLLLGQPGSGKSSLMKVVVFPWTRTCPSRARSHTTARHRVRSLIACRNSSPMCSNATSTSRS